MRNVAFLQAMLYALPVVCCGTLTGNSIAGVPTLLLPNLINHYTFDNPEDGDLGSPVELDLGLDATPIQLLNGAPRVDDGAWGGSNHSLETGQRNTGPNDDWKAGVMFSSSAESTLTGANGVAGVTIAGWFKPLGDMGDNPSPNTNTSFPFDRFNAFGLAGLLRGDDGDVGVDGHSVRALLEVIDGKVVGLGRRLDMQVGSGRAASIDDWHEVMPPGQWTHLAATFDFDSGAIAIYKNGLWLPTSGSQTDNWEIDEESNSASPTNPAGIKIGGSYPDNSEERNPFNGRIDELTFFNRSLVPREVFDLYRGLSGLPGDFNGDGIVDATDYAVWRGNLGGPADALPNGLSEGVIGSAQFDIWMANYGARLSADSASQSVPEPTTAFLLGWTLIAAHRRASHRPLK